MELDGTQNMTDEERDCFWAWNDYVRADANLFFSGGILLRLFNKELYTKLKTDRDDLHKLWCDMESSREATKSPTLN